MDRNRKILTKIFIILLLPLSFAMATPPSVIINQTLDYLREQPVGAELINRASAQGIEMPEFHCFTESDERTPSKECRRLFVLKGKKLYFNAHIIGASFVYKAWIFSWGFHYALLVHKYEPSLASFKELDTLSLALSLEYWIDENPSPSEDYYYDPHYDFAKKRRASPSIFRKKIEKSKDDFLGHISQIRAYLGIPSLKLVDILHDSRTSGPQRASLMEFKRDFDTYFQ